MAELPRPAAPDAAIEVELAGLGWVPGRVAWQTAGRVGVVFRSGDRSGAAATTRRRLTGLRQGGALREQAEMLAGRAVRALRQEPGCARHPEPVQRRLKVHGRGLAALVGFQLV
ncbi:MAG: hypothetical protein P0Y64_09640 [Candidatus Sphingomonas colombiensis]|nr:hypothetical protein [Sphingomonas sp.]WEK45025.1 MAG: hypothetical protein P0Y64_09640 [Sphingomonas sp.]